MCFPSWQQLFPCFSVCRIKSIKEGHRFHTIYQHIWATTCGYKMIVEIITSWRSYEHYWYWPIFICKVFFWTQMYEQHQKDISTCREVWWSKQSKDIIDAAILSTPEGVTDNSPNVHMASKPVKKPCDRKSLCLFTNILDVNPKAAKRRFVAAKSKRKSMKVCNSLWIKIKKKRAFKNHWADQM